MRTEIKVCDTPHQADIALVNFMFLTMSGGMEYERVTEGKYLLGDAAFLMRSVADSSIEPPPIVALAFVRNNAAVMVNTRPEALEEVARFVDGKLVEALKPTSDPAFSHKLEEPPAEGGDESAEEPGE